MTNIRSPASTDEAEISGLMRTAGFCSRMYRWDAGFASRMHLRLLTAHEAQLLAVLAQLDKGGACGCICCASAKSAVAKLDEQQRDWVAPPWKANV